MTGLRTLHRWIALAAAVFLLNMIVTGTILAWGSIGDARRDARPRLAAPLPTDDLPTLADTIYQIAHKAAPEAPIVSLTLVMGDGQPRGAVTFGGDAPGQLFVNPIAGGYLVGNAGALSPGGATLDWHSFIKRLHRGDFIGDIHGRYLSIFAGLSFLFLLGSGMAMYAKMWITRCKRGRSGYFWT